MASGRQQDLKSILDELSARHRNLSADDIFTVWFLRAYITSNEQQAVEALVGGKGDKSCDAIFVDSAAKAVFVIQAKFRQKFNRAREVRNDLIGLAEVATHLADPLDKNFKEHLNKMNDFTAARLTHARHRVLRDGYRVNLLFVTLGKVSETHRRDAEMTTRRAKCTAALEVIDGKRLMVIVRDYLDGVAPPVPLLDLEMEHLPGVRVSEIANRFDEENELESWVFSMRGDAVGAMFEIADVRLFARNIRGFLGKGTPVNEGMLNTLAEEPNRFFTTITA